jgi:hypothetical protein
VEDVRHEVGGGRWRRGSPTKIRGRIVCCLVEESALLTSLLLAFALAAPEVRPAWLPPTTDTTRCVDAARFLRSIPRVVAIIEPDTVDDWRTGRRLAGCRVTAAGLSRVGPGREAVLFYERVRAAGWVRTPDPRDAPNEASLRFRRAGTDCLFNVMAQGMLFTESEARVIDAVVPGPGDERYHVLVQCIVALPARSR